ncbi:hypothetical protein ACFLUO_05800 [Chloroflexota bacterium]
MIAVKSVEKELSLGFKVRKLRVSQMLTRQELANTAGVSPEEIILFEHNLPLRLDARRRILKELWARRASSNKIATSGLLF